MARVHRVGEFVALKEYPGPVWQITDVGLDRYLVKFYGAPNDIDPALQHCLDLGDLVQEFSIGEDQVEDANPLVVLALAASEGSP